MKYKPHRQFLRLKGHDYRRPSVYSVTICTKDRVCWFEDVVDGKIQPDPSGNIVSVCWHDPPNHYPRAQLDAFILMPNHVHGIILLADHDATIRCGSIGAGPVGAGLRPAPTSGIARTLLLR